MPKLKTHKTAEKRFRMTGTGKIMRSKQGSSHLRRNKAKRVKRLYYEMFEVSHSDMVRIRKSLPYGAK